MVIGYRIAQILTSVKMISKKHFRKENVKVHVHDSVYIAIIASYLAILKNIFKNA